MKKVVLKSITLRNFRGEKERTTEFGGVETTISGENGTGKSRHFDAFVWLLFGKDSKERKDFNVKTLVDGKPVERVDTEVAGVLEVNGAAINLRHVYKEKWVKPRGQAEERFDGHEHEYFWNDVPLKVGEYSARINEIVGDSVFKMITNPMFFATVLKWQEQRETLFQLAGTISDREIAAKKPEYASLLDKISGKSLTDFKREIAARKRKLKDELDTIQPRIDQTQKLMPANADWNALAFEIEGLQKQFDETDKTISDKAAAIRQQYEAVQAKQSEINALKQRRQQVLHEAKTAASEAAFKANDTRRGLESNYKIVSGEIGTVERYIQSLENELKGLKESQEFKGKAVEAKRQEWHDENAREYAGDDKCHTCGQLLPEEMIEDARRIFDESKQATLDRIRAKGTEINVEIERVNVSIAEVEKSLETSRNSLKNKQAELERVAEELKECKEFKETEVIPEKLPEYGSLSVKIMELEAAIAKGTEPVDTGELQNRKKQIAAEMEAAKDALKQRDLIERYHKEIEELEEKGKQLAQQIADVEREEFTIQSFTKARIEECERRINGLFTMVTFKLFEYTIENNEVETCVPLVDGVPFGAANTAGQVNAGLDIINALVRFHGVSAPIFIDGRESVNRLIPTESQIINLVVSNDKELIVR